MKAMKVNRIPDSLLNHPLWVGSVNDSRYRMGYLTFEHLELAAHRLRALVDKGEHVSPNELSLLQELEEATRFDWGD